MDCRRARVKETQAAECLDFADENTETLWSLTLMAEPGLEPD